MIFVTVGTQLPFDRLIKGIDEWAGEQGQEDIFAQIGPTNLEPAHLEWSPFIDTEEFRRRVEEADLIVAHAGMGSIITALELAKPIVVMPRREALGEHRNDHQMATAGRFAAQRGISVVHNKDELKNVLDGLDQLKSETSISSEADPQLIATLRDFINPRTAD